MSERMSGYDAEVGVLLCDNDPAELARAVLRLRRALEEVDRLCPKPGGAGQVARDALRLNP